MEKSGPEVQHFIREDHLPAPNKRVQCDGDQFILITSNVQLRRQKRSNELDKGQVCVSLNF